jgi:hypothetical protein
LKSRFGEAMSVATRKGLANSVAFRGPEEEGEEEEDGDADEGRPFLVELVGEPGTEPWPRLPSGESGSSLGATSVARAAISGQPRPPKQATRS